MLSCYVPDWSPKRIVTCTAKSIRVLVAICFASSCGSITSNAGLTEFFERSVSRIAEIEAAEAAAAVAAKLAFKSVKVAAKNGAYLARTGDEIAYLTTTGELISKWKLDNSAGLTRFITSQAEQHPDAIFQLLAEQEVFQDPSVGLQNLPSNVIVRVVSPDGRISETRLANIHGRIEYLVEGNESKTLFIDTRDQAARSKFDELQKRSFSNRDVNLLTLVDPKANRATTDALDRAARENGIRNTIASSGDIELVIRASRHKLLLVIGHTEGTHFVIRAADGSRLYAVEFRRLASFARANEATTILLGCSTGLGGLLTEVQSLEIAAQLKSALAAKNYRDFFSALGTPESPFVLTAEQINGSTVLVARRLEAKQRMAGIGIETATTVWISSAPALTTSAMALLSIAGFGTLFITGLGLMLAMFSARPLMVMFSTNPLKWGCWVVGSPILLVFALAILLAGFLLSVAFFSTQPAKWGLLPLARFCDAVSKARDELKQSRQTEVTA